MRIYNTATRRKEEFFPLDGHTVRMYTCGLTVQDYCHIGHARVDIFWDCAKRWLQHLGYQTVHVSNFTDINEKIAAKALEAGIDPMQYAEDFIKAYQDDATLLGITGADVYARASQEMPEIIGLIEELIAKGHAYVNQGNVYFRVASFADYGKLSGRRTEELQEGTRAVIGDGKESPEDFALWTVAQAGEPEWESPWGLGTPGWHIECSAMSMHHLGHQYDLHGGGIDILFPHHENEAAQSCACGYGYARFWVHNGLVNSPDGSKMSKSLNNFFRVRDILQQYPAGVLHFYLHSTHYRSPVSFGVQLMDEAVQSLQRLQRMYSSLAQAEQENYPASARLDTALQEATDKFAASMNDDFNTSAAVAVLFELSRDINTAMQEHQVSPEQARRAREHYHFWMSILGCAEMLIAEETELERLDADITSLVEERQQARLAKNWARADEIRSMLDEMGIVLMDTPEGQTWKRK